MFDTNLIYKKISRKCLQCQKRIKFFKYLIYRKVSITGDLLLQENILIKFLPFQSFFTFFFSLSYDWMSQQNFCRDKRKIMGKRINKTRQWNLSFFISTVGIWILSTLMSFSSRSCVPQKYRGPKSLKLTSFVVVPKRVKSYWIELNEWHTFDVL